jgi:hypothetical protein
LNGDALPRLIHERPTDAPINGAAERHPIDTVVIDEPRGLHPPVPGIDKGDIPGTLIGDCSRSPREAAVLGAVHREHPRPCARPGHDPCVQGVKRCLGLHGMGPIYTDRRHIDEACSSIDGVVTSVGPHPQPADGLFMSSFQMTPVPARAHRHGCPIAVRALS